MDARVCACECVTAHLRLNLGHGTGTAEGDLGVDGVIIHGRAWPYYYAMPRTFCTVHNLYRNQPRESPCPKQINRLVFTFLRACVSVFCACVLRQKPEKCSDKTNGTTLVFVGAPGAYVYTHTHAAKYIHATGFLFNTHTDTHTNTHRNIHKLTHTHTL